ncbi:MAG: hypothetical protein ACRYFU_21990, partial [Janthinobacterium lividum]
GSHINAEGFREWHPGETHRLATAFYHTYHSAGVGAVNANPLTPDQARHYTPKEVLSAPDNWNPSR